MFREIIRHGARSGPERFVKTGVVDPPNVLQSPKGRYFVGRTGMFHVAGGHQALVLLQMPRESSRLALVASITVTSNLGRRAIFYFDAQTPSPIQSI